MARLSRVPLKIVQIVFLLSLLCKKVHKVGNSDFNVGVHGQVAELSCGRELSSVVPTRNQSTKRSAIITVGNYLKASAILCFTRDLLFVNVLILCGDIAQNPGPGAASRGVGLKVCHWNIQHLTDCKLEEIRVKLTNPNNGEEKPDILILTETFCSAKVPDSFYSTPGFHLHRKDRIGRSGGGILAFVNSSLQVKRREDLEATDLECLWLETCPFKSKRPLLIAGIYRPPSYKVADDKRLGKNIENAHLLNREIVILGDFNIDFLCAKKVQKHSLLKTMRNLNMSQLVHKITRPVSKTCLDHIWSSHPERLHSVRVMSSGISDHLPVIVTRKFIKCPKNNKDQHRTITYRDIKGLNKEQFVSSLHEAPWDCAFVFEDTNDVVDAWYNVFNDIIDEHLPLKQKRVKRKIQPKWFNTEILKGIKARDKLLNKARKSQTERDWNAFKRAKNTVTQLIRSTKQSYFKDKVTENKNNSRKLWNLIKCLSNDDKGAESGIKEIVENETNITDKQTIAEILNSFFVDQPKNLVAALGLSSLTVPSTVTSARQNISAFDLPNITQKRVVELLLSIPTHKATGGDGISAKILRIAAPAIAPSLTKLLNHGLSTQTFPTIWKIAKVTPVFKGNGSRNDKNNYRPISVLPILSKVLEKHICEHLCNFLRENDFFHPLQSGFRKSHSTETALIRLVDQLLFNLDNDKVTGLVFIDYKKAFDLIDHKLLLSKLKALGVGERSLPMFRDYMSGRRQFVNIDGYYSTQRALTLGVPQGSILGPILFLVFINDLPAALQHSVVDIYADDTTISYSTHYMAAPNDISNGLQTDIDEIMNWSADNKMILNESKTKSMLVTGKRLGKKQEQSTLQLYVNSTELEQVSSHKLLGVTIDSQLTFDQHVENLCTKLSQRIAVLRKIRRSLPLDQRKLYYNAMIKQTMLYASTVWTSCSAENLQRVFKLQKRAARVILNADTKANSVQLFRELDWVPFYHEANVNRLSMVYKRLSGDCPYYLSQMLIRNADINERSSRHGLLNLVCPRFKRESEGGRSFTVSTTRLWNTIPSTIRNKPSLVSFKKATFKFFKDTYKHLDHFTF